MIKPTLIIALALLLAGTAFYSLSGSPLSAIQAAYFTDSALQPTRVEGQQFPKTLIDATGAEQRLSSPPQRIVSLTLGSDEMLYQLVDQQRIVAVTYLADDNNSSNVAGKFAPGIVRTEARVEQVLALEPDLVFVASYTRAETVRLLFNAGIAVVRLAGHNTFAELEQSIRLVSQVTGSEQQANLLLEKLRKYSRDIQSRVQDLTRPRVLFYNLSGYTMGPGTLVDEMISMAGGYNVVRDTGITGSQKISPEMAIGLEPDVILMSGGFAQEQEQGQLQPAQRLLANPAWQSVPAIQSQRVYNVNDTWTLSVSHFSWQGIGQIARLLHPGAFKP